MLELVNLIPTLNALLSCWLWHTGGWRTCYHLLGGISFCSFWLCLGQAMLMVQHTVVNTQCTHSLVTVNAMDYSSHIQHTMWFGGLSYVICCKMSLPIQSMQWFATTLFPTMWIYSRQSHVDCQWIKFCQHQLQLHWNIIRVTRSSHNQSWSWSFVVGARCCLKELWELLRYRTYFI